MAVDLQALLDLMESKNRETLVEKFGSTEKLAESLGSDVSTGLKSTTDQELDTRRQQYGENKMDRKPPPTIFALFMEAMEDTTIIILLIAAGSLHDFFSFHYSCCPLWSMKLNERASDRFFVLQLTAISIVIGIIICTVHLGKACPRRPLWDVGAISHVRSSSFTSIFCAVNSFNFSRIFFYLFSGLSGRRRVY